MSEEYFMEEVADMAIPHISSFIDIESQLVNEEHNLHFKIDSAGHILAHLDERIPELATNLHDLNRRILIDLEELRDLIESENMRDLRIVGEESKIKDKLENDVKHKDWKAVRTLVDKETKEEKEALRLEERELKDLHYRFISLMKLMKRSKLVKAVEDYLTVLKDKDEFVKLEEYYFLQIYRFLRFYEKVFRDLWEKELILAKKLKKDYKKIK